MYGFNNQLLKPFTLAELIQVQCFLVNELE